MIISARRAPRVHSPSRSQQPGIVLGLRYERAFVKKLKATLGGRSFVVEHNPWFYYKSDEKSGACSPDVLLYDVELDLVFVIEVKYTWVPDALTKLNDLYCPVVKSALNHRVEPLVVVKRLTSKSPEPRLGLLTRGASPLFQWIEAGPIVL